MSTKKRKMGEGKAARQSRAVRTEISLERKIVAEGVKSVDTVDKYREVRWCDHAIVNNIPILGSTAFHCVTKGQCHMVVDNRQLTILCNSCYSSAIRNPANLNQPFNH